MQKSVMSRPALVAQETETQCAPTVMVCRNEPGYIPGSAGRVRVQIPGVHALRLIFRVGKKHSMVSSIICDGWLMLS